MKDTISKGEEIEFDHTRNSHSLEGARAAVSIIFPEGVPHSALDVGCGIGAWMRAAAEAGATDYLGVDGVAIPPEQLLVDQNHFVRGNLAAKLDLGRRFDVVFCMEVAEHLDPEHAGVLLDTLVRHSDLIVFSAACPGQPGQHHVNCRWPVYWQEMFNARGYACEDEVRWRLWECEAVEPWYRQNIFIARRAPSEAGREPRLRAAVHPQVMPSIRGTAFDDIWAGNMSSRWYVSILVKALKARVRRLFQVEKLRREYSKS